MLAPCTRVSRLNSFFPNYHPQTKFAKVMFSQVSVFPGGGVHVRDMHGRELCMVGGHAWQGACVAGGMCDEVACTVRSIHGGGMCGGGHALQGAHAWQGACMAGEMATAAGSTHPTGIHFCFSVVFICFRAFEVLRECFYLFCYILS